MFQVEIKTVEEADVEPGRNRDKEKKSLFLFLGRKGEGDAELTSRRGEGKRRSGVNGPCKCISPHLPKGYKKITFRPQRIQKLYVTNIASTLDVGHGDIVKMSPPSLFWQR